MIFILISGFQVFWGKFKASEFLSACKSVSCLWGNILMESDINIPIFFGLYLFWKLTGKTLMWTPEEMDFDDIRSRSLSSILVTV